MLPAKSALMLLAAARTSGGFKQVVVKKHFSSDVCKNVKADLKV